MDDNEERKVYKEVKAMVASYGGIQSGLTNDWEQ